MSATGGGPALPGMDAPARALGDGGPRVTLGRSPRLRMVLGLAKVEAWLLARSLLVLAGLVAGGFGLWLYFRQMQPLWWDAAWRIGWGQLILAITVLPPRSWPPGEPAATAWSGPGAIQVATSRLPMAACKTPQSGTCWPAR